jgi:hypothetical protein
MAVWNDFNTIGVERQMSYDFFSHHGSQHLNNGAWSSCFDLAIEFGWHPSCTAPPDDCEGNWCGSYFSNNFQKVEDSDARALGEALLRGIATEEARERDNPTKWPDGWLRLLRGFAEFARRGGFTIA